MRSRRSWSWAATSSSATVRRPAADAPSVHPRGLRPEAVIAAVYLDGGLAAASSLIHRVLLDCEREEVVEERRRDYKTVLQELVQREPNRTLVYRMAEESGPDHDKTFTFEVLLNGAVVGRGEGHSKKEAEQMAARAALERLE